ncbi:MAG: UPF0182 family protein [Planctomycetota bacterium]|jgi:uncharacterized membrane protein (UPF0182 family)
MNPTGTGTVPLQSEVIEDALGTQVPAATPPLAPEPARLWWRAVILSWVLLGFFLLDRLCLLLMDYWLLESLGFEGVFWTNFGTGAVLFAAGLASSAAVIGPAFAYDVGKTVRKIVVNVALFWGVVSGYLLSLRYVEFLMAAGQDFGQVDPVFGNDLGFYVFTVPPIWTAWWFLFIGTSLALSSWIFCAYVAHGETAARDGMTRVGRFWGVVGTRGTRITLGILAFLAACGWWLGRYDLLTADNSGSSVFSGASYVDVVGPFSTVYAYHVTALITLAVAALLIVILGRVHGKVVRGEAEPPTGRWTTRKLGLAVVLLLCADFGFMAAVGLRQMVFVAPNEPVVQLPYIQRHIDATRSAYNLGNVETVNFIPKDVGDPLPDADALLESPVFRNAPLWPGFCSYLEDLVDIQHQDRILLTDGDNMVYGPLLEIFRQQQKLRAYYNFLDMDTIRVAVDGEPTMLVSSVREVPLMEPAPWLAWWGQQFMLFTHGYGLVTAASGEKTSQGNPVYTSKGIPVASQAPALQARNQRVYYGEGAGSMAYSNVQRMTELDYPTDEGRATITFPNEVKAGVKLDSLLKRLVFGYKSGQFFEIVFSDLIDEDTRVHYYRTPIERLQRVAPFLYYDTDPFAVVAGGNITWMVNGMTWADAYPYSSYQDLGDKSDTRSPYGRVPHVRMNYVRDAVKATVDGYTGKLTLYKWADEPVLNTLAEIYPDLFVAREKMPADVRSQIQYPVQLMHVQFDDQYIIYQMNDPMYFFNMEDMWDDADEVLGPVLDEGHAIRFSIEPFYLMVDTGDDLYPTSKHRTQFALTMLFTPEKALNLRAIPMIYQDGEDYGRMVCFQVPKGHYYIGPEQADATIDQEPAIAQQVSWWNRRGLEVIRGHTTGLLVDGEVIYIEPIFLRSQQNPVTQLKRVCVVFRGKARMAPTLEEALRAAIDAHREG